MNLVAKRIHDPTTGLERSSELVAQICHFGTELAKDTLHQSLEKKSLIDKIEATSSNDEIANFIECVKWDVKNERVAKGMDKLSAKKRGEKKGAPAAMVDCLWRCPLEDPEKVALFPLGEAFEKITKLDETGQTELTIHDMREVRSCCRMGPGALGFCLRSVFFEPSRLIIDIVGGLSPPRMAGRIEKANDAIATVHLIDWVSWANQGQARKVLESANPHYYEGWARRLEAEYERGNVDRLGILRLFALSVQHAYPSFAKEHVIGVLRNPRLVTESGLLQGY
jgi:hypothetical protein